MRKALLVVLAQLVQLVRKVIRGILVPLGRKVCRVYRGLRVMSALQGLLV